MRVFRRSVGMMVIGPMPERASTKADQNASRVLPIGVTTPIPVMTTRFISMLSPRPASRPSRRHHRRWQTAIRSCRFCPDLRFCSSLLPDADMRLASLPCNGMAMSYFSSSAKTISITSSDSAPNSSRRLSGVSCSTGIFSDLAMMERTSSMIANVLPRATPYRLHLQPQSAMIPLFDTRRSISSRSCGAALRTAAGSRSAMA